MRNRHVIGAQSAAAATERCRACSQQMAHPWQLTSATLRSRRASGGPILPQRASLRVQHAASGACAVTSTMLVCHQTLAPSTTPAGLRQQSYREPWEHTKRCSPSSCCAAASAPVCAAGGPSATKFRITDFKSRSCKFQKPSPANSTPPASYQVTTRQSIFAQLAFRSARAGPETHPLGTA